MYNKNGVKHNKNGAQGEVGHKKTSTITKKLFCYS